MTDNPLTKQVRHHAMWMCLAGLSCELTFMLGFWLVASGAPIEYYGKMFYLIIGSFLVPPVSFLIGSLIVIFLSQLVYDEQHPFFIECSNNTIWFCLSTTLYIFIIQIGALVSMMSAVAWFFIVAEILLLIMHVVAVIVAAQHAANGKVFVYPHL